MTSGLGSPSFSREPGLSNPGERGHHKAAPPRLPGPRQLVARGRHLQAQCPRDAKIRVRGYRTRVWRASHTVSLGGVGTSSNPHLRWGLLSIGTLELGSQVSPAVTPFPAGTWMRSPHSEFLPVPEFPQPSLTPTSHLRFLPHPLYPRATPSSVRPSLCLAPGGVAKRSSCL